MPISNNQWPSHLAPLFTDFTPLEFFQDYKTLTALFHCLDIPTCILIQEIRRVLEVPILINYGPESGPTRRRAFRTPWQNIRAGGSKNSMHLKGKALDCTIPPNDKDITTFNLFQLAKRFTHNHNTYGRNLQFNGIIWYKNRNFVHLDTRVPVIEGYKFVKVVE